MKIVRGKVAFALVGVVLFIPTMLLTFAYLKEAAMNRCTSSATAEPDSQVTVEFNLGGLDWICHKRWTETGVLEDKHISLLP